MPPSVPAFHVADLDPAASYTELALAIQGLQSINFNGCTWNDSIDWSAALISTHVSSALISLSAQLDYQVPSSEAAALSGDVKLRDDLINFYFANLESFFYYQPAQSFTTQAYDDMGWLVLGWLEAIKFIGIHSSLHYSERSYVGAQMLPQFAHRARLFADLLAAGYNDPKFNALCGGGLVWNAALEPYKNAISNHLYIAVNIGMYLYFPGDADASPSYATNSPTTASPCLDRTSSTLDLSHAAPGTLNAASPPLPPIGAQNQIYLDRAIEAYDWLQSSQMTNPLHFYTDGFHLSDWDPLTQSSAAKKCDARDEMVYTYNQGVILSALRGLYDATGNTKYLDDAYTLIDAVVAATGFGNADADAFLGLGRGGVMEDGCDSVGDCSQDVQSFKGAFFHHFNRFCNPLPAMPFVEGVTFAVEDQDLLGRMSESLCERYVPWVARNAGAARDTKDQRGRYGGWWGPAYGTPNETAIAAVVAPPAGAGQMKQCESCDGEIDYRNDGKLLGTFLDLAGVELDTRALEVDTRSSSDLQKRTPASSSLQGMGKVDAQTYVGVTQGVPPDVNDRGRGRTVETQAGALAVFNALYSMTSVRRNVVLAEPPSGVAPGDGSELEPIPPPGDDGVTETEGNRPGNPDGEGGGNGNSGDGKGKGGGEANTGGGRKLGIPSKAGYIAKFPRHHGG